jgi:hypothetical protein
MSEGKTNDAERLKKLREARRETIDKVRKTIKTQNRDIKKIREQLRSGAKTIPEIAGATRMSPSRVLQYVSGLKNYGLLVEGAKEGDYFTYELSK